MERLRYTLNVSGALLALGALAGCQAGGTSTTAQSSKTDQAGIFAASEEVPIMAVHCLYEQKPWLNLDKAGDRDPEGLWYRVVLETRDGKRVWRDGMFHVEMYRIDRVGQNRIKRTLVSDWHYPTSSRTRFGGGLIGNGYKLELAWPTKDVAGREIEIITRYESPEGHTVRSGTKRFRVPKYDT